jgi:hypothetical protein
MAAMAQNCHAREDAVLLRRRGAHNISVQTYRLYAATLNHSRKPSAKPIAAKNRGEDKGRRGGLPDGCGGNVVEDAA